MPISPSPTSRSLFHYTTGNGLIGIVRDKSLYATHFDFVNDASECKVIKGLLTPLFQKELEELTEKLVTEGYLRREIFSEFGRRIYSLETENFFNALFQATYNVSPFYLTSFCEHPPGSRDHEHGLLSQWRGYARGGFAIEFDELALDECTKKEKQKFNYLAILTDAVSYRDHDKRVPFDKFVGLVGAMMQDMFAEGAGVDISKLTGIRSLDEFAQSFLGTAPFLKDRGFEEEREYRIVALAFRSSRLDSEAVPPAKPIKFKMRPNGTLAPYIELFKELGERLPIKSVVVGPHPNQKNQMRAVELLLEQYGLDVPIRASGIPFQE
jgi:hypothetical protein